MTNAEQKRIFARNLDRLIVKSGHTRQEVADALGFNPDAENGKHRINAISSVPRGKFRGIKKDPHRKCDEGFSLLSIPVLRPHGCPGLAEGRAGIYHPTGHIRSYSTIRGSYGRRYP